MEKKRLNNIITIITKISILISVLVNIFNAIINKNIYSILMVVWEIIVLMLMNLYEKQEKHINYLYEKLLNLSIDSISENLVIMDILKIIKEHEDEENIPKIKLNEIFDKYFDKED